MDKKEVYREMEEMLGLVPSFFKSIPDSSLGLEWELFKRTQIEDGAVPNKYRELIGIAISGVTKCHYCALFHTEMAKLHGASEAEIEDAVHYAKQTTGWSTYINGLQIDYEQFKREVLQAVNHIRTQQRKKAA